MIRCPPVDAVSHLAKSPSCAHRRAGTDAYTTEIEHYQRVALTHGADGELWTVERPDGVMATYAPTTSGAHGVLEWQLSRVEDTSGNCVEYAWTPAHDGQAARLTAIRYSDVEIRFQVEPRPDPMVMATGDALIANRTRLQVIDEFAALTRIRTYALRYSVHADGTRRSFLDSVQQYGSDAIVDADGVHGGHALPAVTFDWSPPAGGAGAWRARESHAVRDWATDWRPGPGDDGAWTQVLDGGNQGSVPFPSGVPSVDDGVPSRWVSGDFNGDGRMDTALVSPQSSTSWRFNVDAEITQADGGFRGYHRETPWSTPAPGADDTPNPPHLRTYKVLVGDEDGDGRDDLTLVLPTLTQGRSTWYAGILQGTPLGILVPMTGVSEIPLEAPTPFMGDVNGDGRSDLIATGHEPADPGCGTSIRVGTGGANSKNGFDFDATQSVCWPDYPGRERLQVADVNGDSRADLVAFAPAEAKDASSHASIVTAIATGATSFAMHRHDTGQHWSPQETSYVEKDHKKCPFLFPPGRCSFRIETGVPGLWTDVDGDGRTDLVVLVPREPITTTSPVDARTLLSRGDGSFADAKPGEAPLTIPAISTVYRINDVLDDGDDTVVSEAPDMIATDVNGDGFGDLVQEYSSAGGATIDEYPSDGDHSWGSGARFERNWSGDCRRGCPGTTPQVMQGDLNGDGVTDFLFAHPHAPGPDASHSWSALDGRLSGSRAIEDRLLSADTNADGRADLVGVHGTGDGIEVRVLRQLAGGGYTRLPPVVTPISDAHIADSKWFVGDVNGDQRADLINTDRNVTVLLATGDHDWTATRSPLGLSYNVRPLVGDVNADGRSDLVLLGTAGHGDESGVQVLEGHADGTMSGTWEPVDPQAQETLDDPGWLLASIDGGLKVSLVNINTRTGLVHTLAREDGHWHAVTDSLPPGLRVGNGDDDWTPVALDDDAAADFARVVASPDGTLAVQSLLGYGDGHFRPVNATGLGALAGGSVEGSYSLPWNATDTDQDGDSDFVHVFNSGPRLAVQTLASTGDGGWSLMTSWHGGAFDPAEIPATNRWRVGDVAGSGRPSALRLDDRGEFGLAVTGWDARTEPEVISRTANGLGASSEISYQSASAPNPDDSVVPVECRLPAEAAATPIVRSIATTVQAAPGDTSTLRYACGRYSVPLRSFLGWSETWTVQAAASNRPTSVEHVVRDAFDVGVLQTRLTETTDAEGRALRRSSATYAALGSQPLPRPDLVVDGG